MFVFIVFYSKIEKHYRDNCSQRYYSIQIDSIASKAANTIKNVSAKRKIITTLSKYLSYVF